MSQSPKVTVLMATYNRAHLVRAAIKSVQSQHFADWELIITDDGSADATPHEIAVWQNKEPRIIYIRSEVNQGISKNYNQGLHKARGKYIAMIDDDDPWISVNKLTRQVDFLEKNPEYVGCGGGVVVVNEEGKELYRYLKPESDQEIRHYMRFANPMANSTTMCRLEVARKVGFYDDSIRYSGDRDFWLKMGLEGKLYNFPEYFSYYTMTGMNTSILKLRPHLKTSLLVMRRYRWEYPGYYRALIINYIQYWYSFLPIFIRNKIHTTLAQAKRRLFK